jgi:hypothetical protein
MLQQAQAKLLRILLLSAGIAALAIAGYAQITTT